MRHTYLTPKCIPSFFQCNAVVLNILLDSCSTLCVVQCVLHMPQIDFAGTAGAGTAESTAKAQKSSANWGMCSKHIVILSTVPMILPPTDASEDEQVQQVVCVAGFLEVLGKGYQAA